MKIEFTDVFEELFQDVKNGLKRELMYKLEALKKFEMQNTLNNQNNGSATKTALSFVFLKNLQAKLQSTMPEPKM